MAHDNLEARVRARTEELSSAVESLRQSEERFRGTFDAAAIGMALVAPGDAGSRPITARSAAMVGYTEEELLATDFQALTHPDDVDASLAQAQRSTCGCEPTRWRSVTYTSRATSSGSW